MRPAFENYAHILRIFGKDLDSMRERLGDLLSLKNPRLRLLAENGEPVIYLQADQDNAIDFLPLIAEIKKRLGNVIYGIDVANLQSLVVDLLRQKQQTLATAESCTGGLVAELITAISGASEVFTAGFVVYANAAKVGLLNVSSDLLASQGAVCEEVARQLANNVRRKCATDWGIGITGIAGPTGATPSKGLGLVHIALSNAKNTWLRTMQPQTIYPGRQQIRKLAAKHALDMLRLAINGQEVN